MSALDKPPPPDCGHQLQLLYSMMFILQTTHKPCNATEYACRGVGNCIPFAYICDFERVCL